MVLVVIDPKLLPARPSLNPQTPRLVVLRTFCDLAECNQFFAMLAPANAQ
jgi:hypothetical protein